MDSISPEGWGTPSQMQMSIESLESYSDTISTKTPTRRQMAKKYWQPNSEATKCAMAACENEFCAWPFSGRHHCRACGRVVCAECSQGTRVMHPPRGETGGPRTVRVCDACFRLGQNFDFQPSPTHNKSIRSLRRQNSEDSLASHEFGNDKNLTGSSRSFHSIRSLRAIASAPNLMALNGLNNTPTRVPQGGASEGTARRRSGDSDDKASEGERRPSSDEDEYSSCDTAISSANATRPRKSVTPPPPPPAPKPVDVVTLPQQIKAKGMGPKRDSHRKIEELAADDEGLAEKFRKLEADYAHSSYYQGLLEYEPEALKALLMSEVSAQRSSRAAV